MVSLSNYAKDEIHR